jgi:hypothetical protein
MQLTNNKTFLLISATLALLFSGCAKEMPFSRTAESGVLVARIEGALATRTSFDNSEGKFTWTDGDMLAVHYSNGSYTTYPVNPSDGTVLASVPPGATRDMYAVYPASSAVASATGNPLKVVFPTNYDISGKLDEPDFSPLPMVAVNDNSSTELDFYHVGGLVRITVDGISPSAHRIEVIFDNSVTGEFNVTFVSGRPVVSAGTPTSSNTTVNFILAETGASVGSRIEPIVLNVPVPCGTYESVMLKTYNASDELLSTQDFSLPKGRLNIARHQGKRLHDYGDLGTPFTLEAIEDGTITVQNENGPVQYRINWGEWIDVPQGENPTIDVVTGDVVHFRGDNSCYYNSSTNAPFVSCNARCYAYGNIMSLISSEGFPMCTELTEEYAFACFFYQNDKIYSHPNKQLLLPATTLTDYCYAMMLYGCYSITTAPELPAKTLAESCYYYMFGKCHSLTSAPKLPATIMEDSCYQSMFLGCTALTEAPELPATTLAQRCYQNMFYDCTNLTKAPELPAMTMAYNCYRQMFYNCTSLTTAPDLPATTLAPECYAFMFRGCTSLSVVPQQLPALTLASQCYHAMFRYCSSLTTAPDLPATTLADRCYNYMFDGCTSLTRAPEILPALTLVVRCYQSMFQDCTSLTTAPILPATTLADGCYAQMLYNCASLNHIKCLAVNISVTDALYRWVSGVAATGTFVKSSDATTWSTGVGGIPSGWTVEEE